MKLKIVFVISICLLSIMHVTAQSSNNSTDLIANTFQSFLDSHKEQKIVLQTDRQLYVIGEKVWFRAFVVNAVSNKVDLATKNLFVDFVDDSDHVIARLVLNNQALKTGGAFTLPDSLRTGFYWLRCYTAKMLSNPGNICIQPLFVLNKSLGDENNFINKYKHGTTNKNSSPVIQFFPERFTSITSVISTGVIKITDANNNPLNTIGSIFSSNDSVITTFTTNKFGLARVTFLYDSQLTYTAVFNINGKAIKYGMAPPKNNGCQLSIANQTAKNVKAFVTIEKKLSADLGTIILGVHKDSLYFAAAGTGSYGINITLENFPGGISSLLVFDQHNHLLGERNIYINKQNIDVNIKPDKKNYAARDNAAININLTDKDAEPVTAALSISVQDAWLAQLSDSMEEINLPPGDALLLGNWIELHKSNLSAPDIDMLMLTIKKSTNNNQEYKDSLQNDLYDDNSKLLNLTGKITDQKNRPLNDIEVSVLSKASAGFFMDADTTKTDGSYKIPLPQNIDSFSLSIQLKDKHAAIRLDKNIIIESFNFPKLITPSILKQAYLLYNLNLVTAVQKYRIDTVTTFQGKGWLQPVIVKTVEKKPLNYDETKRINTISQILTNDKFRYGGYGAISNALLTVPGITYTFGDIAIFGGTFDMRNHIGRPLLIVDGVAMGDASFEYFNALSPADIDFIEVLRGGEAAIYGVRAANGVISVNTKHGPSPVDYSKTNFHDYTPMTYHVSPIFYMPDYANEAIKNSKNTDPRTTIYWNSNIVTDAKGNASVHFYTTDKSTDYVITINGLTSKGEIIYKRIFLHNN